MQRDERASDKFGKSREIETAMEVVLRQPPGIFGEGGRE